MTGKPRTFRLGPEEDPANIDWIIGAQQVRSDRDGVPTDAEMLAGAQQRAKAAGSTDPRDKERRAWEGLLAAALYGYWAGQFRRVRRELERQQAELQAAQAEYTGAEGDEEPEAELALRPGVLGGLDWGAEETLLGAALFALIARLLRGAGETAIAETKPLAEQIIGAALSWDIYDQHAARFAETYRYDLIRDLTESTRTQLGKAISGWIRTPADFTDLVTRVRRIIPPNPYPALRDRAVLVAQTETTRVYAESRMAALRALGLRRMLWLTANDELVCTRTCRDLDGVAGDLATQTWIHPVSGDVVKMPAHPGCRCRCVADPSELEQNVGQKEFDPNQPRDPAGTPTGGQWTDTGAGNRQGLMFRPRPDWEQQGDRQTLKVIDEIAKTQGLTRQQVIDKCAERVEAITQNPIAIRRGIRGANGVLDTGRFKTQFETGTSGGVFVPKMRKDAEYNGLGVPYDVEHEMRPVYGYFAAHKDLASSYGEVEFILNDEVKDRSTLTLDDSLGWFGSGWATGSPVAEPADVSGWDGHARLLASDDPMYAMRRFGSYPEAQIQGGVTLRDVRKVVLHANSPSEELRPELAELHRRMRDLGIDVEVVHDS